MNIREAIAKVAEGVNLTETEAEQVMNSIMEGEATDAQIAGFLIGLRMKGETPEEVTAFARVMRRKATRIVTSRKNLVDTCGTGGDGKHTFNISTASALVVAASGIAVAKHGNRSASSTSGGADVLEALGVNIEISPEMIGKCIDEVGIGFLFAPMLHKAMKYAIGPRREMGVRTVFNILGPMTNPAGAEFQLLGVFAPELTDLMAQVLAKLGSRRAFVVHGEGLDEITISGKTIVAEVNNGRVTSYLISPQDFGIEPGRIDDLVVSSPDESAEIIRSVFRGDRGPHRDIVLLNAGAGILVGGGAANLQDGIARAAELIDSGEASRKLDQLIEFTNEVGIR